MKFFKQVVNCNIRWVISFFFEHMWNSLLLQFNSFKKITLLFLRILCKLFSFFFFARFFLVFGFFLFFWSFFLCFHLHLLLYIFFFFPFFSVIFFLYLLSPFFFFFLFLIYHLFNSCLIFMIFLRLISFFFLLLVLNFCCFFFVFLSHFFFFFSLSPTWSYARFFHPNPGLRYCYSNKRTHSAKHIQSQVIIRRATEKFLSQQISQILSSW